MPRNELPARPQERTAAPREKFAASGSGVGGGQRLRPSGRGAELARTGAGMASQPGP